MGESANGQMGESANGQMGGLRYVGDGTVLVLEGRQVPPRDLTAEEVKYYNIDFLLAARYAGRALYERVEVSDGGK